ncbi:uncharacterized protein SEPMUDRAFT_104784 [Sphaerulina musiva SO2202]|uniref:Uncharacterized protein n=1 Tax=Sphaerulina musiva (strain SO2202) TaxID=692275 RepID=N1QJZ1_SPHMS|nr:uncharacterized protein SEPMUDRAFT_104784 [Sphaerulina musiva SO2202]EMF17551.1 hypothetical protein SEPMUDRAFT_104784 [Sphaerulina musiva SO2202]
MALFALAEPSQPHCDAGWVIMIAVSADDLGKIWSRTVIDTAAAAMCVRKRWARFDGAEAPRCAAPLYLLLPPSAECYLSSVPSAVRVSLNNSTGRHRIAYCVLVGEGTPIIIHEVKDQCQMGSCATSVPLVFEAGAGTGTGAAVRKVSAGVDQAALGRDGIPQSPHFNTSLTPNLTSTKTLYLLPHVVILVNLPCRVTGARQQQAGQAEVKVAVVPRARLAFLVDLSIASLARCLGGQIAQWVGHHSESATGYPIPLPGPALPGPAINVSSRGRRSHQMQKARLLSPHILLPTPNDCAVAHMQFLWKKGSRRCTVALSHGSHLEDATLPSSQHTRRSVKRWPGFKVNLGRVQSIMWATTSFKWMFRAACCQDPAILAAQRITMMGDDSTLVL